ncbi:MAG TPA: hypothetical protein VFJ29_06990, partial [Candidatus Kapabacteria bacterium]|nr:hypothetical protein [Candidatus Kapabacteria bacterium]
MTVALRQWISRSGDIDRWVTFCLFAAYLTWPIYIFQIAQIGTFPVIVSMVFMVLAVALWLLRFLIGRQTVAWHTSTLWVIAICTAALLSETTLIMQGAPSSHSVLSLIHLCFYALAVIVWSSESHAADLFIKVLRIQILFAVV